MRLADHVIDELSSLIYARDGAWDFWTFNDEEGREEAAAFELVLIKKRIPYQRRDSLSTIHFVVGF